MGKTARVVVIVVIVLLAIFESWSLLHSRGVAQNARETTANAPTPPGASSSSASPSAVLASRLTTPAPTKPSFVAPDEAAMIEIDKVSLMIRDYRTMAGENPVGTNAEIMAAVMGGNSRQATFGPPEGMSLNESGELIDRWGTPYFFHQLSKTQMEIHSAGPDKIMWTEDDPIIK